MFAIKRARTRPTEASGEPLFDERTSHFLTVAFAVFAAVGVASMCAVLARRKVLIGVVVAASAAALFTANVSHDIRTRSIPGKGEDVRTPTAYVAANRQPADVILLSSATTWGFGYYWPYGRPGWRPSTAVATGFLTTFPDQPEIVAADDRTIAAIRSAVHSAFSRAGTGPGARIWLVRTHVSRPEDQLWKTVLAGQRLQLQMVLPCSLMLLTPLPPDGTPGKADVPALSCY